ncbi:MAG: CRISPR-associated endoribonuclease Cas6 [Candidatus Aenigmatarchaeota archaeon]
MRLKVKIGEQQLILENPYYGLLQGAIYSGLSAPLFEKVHNKGFRSVVKPCKVFRFFSFSPLFGKERFTIKQNGVCKIKGNVHFFISSLIPEFIEDLKDNLETKGLKLGGVILPVKCKVMEFPFKNIEGEKKAIAILKVHNLFVAKWTGHWKETSHRHQEFDFWSFEFDRAIIDSLNEKIKTAFAYGLVKPFEPLLVIRGKNLIKEAFFPLRKNQVVFKTYTCELLVESNMSTLQFIYAIGLGAKTSHGLGFTEIKGLMQI